MNDAQLQIELAKAFPEILRQETNSLHFRWIEGDKRITDYEWLQVCWDCEESLSNDDKWKFQPLLMGSVSAEIPYEHATWQQRATALIKVKGGTEKIFQIIDRHMQQERASDKALIATQETEHKRLCIEFEKLLAERDAAHKALEGVKVNLEFIKFRTGDPSILGRTLEALTAIEQVLGKK
jgi:hypothetical protein